MWRRAVALHFFTFHSSLFTCPSRECSAGLAVLRFPRRKPAPPPGTLRWARFLPDEKSGKESPKAGPSPALWNPPRGTGCPCVLLFAALGLVGSHRRRGDSTESICFSVWLSFYRQGLTLVCRCFQLSKARLPAAGTPHTGVRPWKQGHRLTEKEMRSIDLPGHLCDPTRARAGHRIDAVPASYPREVLRGERPKWLFVHFGQSKWTPSGKRPHQAGKPELV